MRSENQYFFSIRELRESFRSEDLDLDGGTIDPNLQSAWSAEG
jgi:hypothetical protein